MKKRQGRGCREEGFSFQLRWNALWAGCGNGKDLVFWGPFVLQLLQGEYIVNYSQWIGCLLAAGAFLGWSGSVRADFMIDPNPRGDKFYNGDAYKDVSSFTGTVGGQHSGPEVTVDTVGNVDTGAGFATIKPIKGGTLSSLTFTPADGNLFDDFSFRGQLEAAGSVTLTVQDNQGHAAQVFTFSGLPKDADFDRIGIEAVAGSGETIKWVRLTSDGFKEEKQNEFSFAPAHRAVPAPASFWGGLALVSCLAAARSRQVI